jgi:hypothetical protein
MNRYRIMNVRRMTLMRSAATTSPCLRALGRLAAALVLVFGLFSAASAAHAMGGGSPGASFHSGSFHGGFHHAAFMHRSAFTHRFAGHRRFAFNHRFDRDHRFGPHRRFFAPFGDFGFDGFGFDDAFLGAPNTAPEFAGPEDFSQASPPGPSVEPVQKEQPFAAHDVRVGSGHGAEASAGSRKDSGTVVVMRPGFQDEVVTVPRDAGRG